MSNSEYTPVALDENNADTPEGATDKDENGVKYSVKDKLFFLVPVIAIFAIGFVVGGTWVGIKAKEVRVKGNELLSPQSFIPESLYSGFQSLKGS
jgi:hypothetical protein